MSEVLSRCLPPPSSRWVNFRWLVIMAVCIYSYVCVYVCMRAFKATLLKRTGVHVSKIDTLSLARAKAFAELGFSTLSVIAAAFLGGQWETFSR